MFVYATKPGQEESGTDASFCDTGAKIWRQQALWYGGSETFDGNDAPRAAAELEINLFGILLLQEACGSYSRRQRFLIRAPQWLAILQVLDLAQYLASCWLYQHIFGLLMLKQSLPPLKMEFCLYRIFFTPRALCSRSGYCWACHGLSSHAQDTKQLACACALGILVCLTCCWLWLLLSATLNGGSCYVASLPWHW